MSSTGNKYIVIQQILALLWIGLLLGVSFLATPVKFLAPSLTLPVALDVGRQTFAFFNPLELLLAILLLGSVALTLVEKQINRSTLVIPVALLLLVLLQTLWLLPVLDDRVEVVLQGGTPPASSLHSIYIAVDVAKVILLGFVAFTRTRSLAGG